MPTYSCVFTFKDATTKTLSNVVSITLSNGYWMVKNLNTTNSNITSAFSCTRFKVDVVNTVSITANT